MDQNIQNIGQTRLVGDENALASLYISENVLKFLCSIKWDDNLAPSRHLSEQRKNIWKLILPEVCNLCDYPWI